ncbi:hypothetical protein Rhopal_004017-T1 [Rhodotorula paludigena]|uniref:Uncharacterized protein n=1 Tax=Rhodotorula paludigena TaxID=86838 RepID=A0AAV5GLB1_9BASI|nr:hypothetical protein Rhopal_004017-T1 [Rhodotorula paludigena]
MPRRFDPSEPRKPENALPYRYTSPSGNFADLMAFASMLCSGLAMLTRFAIWPWFGLIFAVSSILGTKNLGSNKQGDQGGSMLSGWSALMFALTTFFSIYSPILMGQAVKSDATWPFGWNKGLVMVAQQGVPRPTAK